ncbi:MAG: TIGR02172 family protein [Bacteroidales bacterium]|nr:TIGR02172 family protein [Bacteroidales bacterium]
MTNAYLDTAFLDKAIEFAVKAHANSERRGKGFPYIIHPLEAMEIVSTMTSDQELLAAAALHDTVEDTEVTIEDIRREFGDRVASLVAVESDKEVGEKSLEESWKERKQAAIDRLANASYEAKVVAMGDKLSNMRAIWRDYEVQGDDLWNIFHVKDKSEHEWHYRGLAHSMYELGGTFAFREFTALIDRVFGPETKPELIDMNDYEESGDGFTAISYNHKDGKKMIKLYSDIIPDEVAVNELYTSRNIDKLGFRIPHAIRLVTDGKRVGVEFERVVGKRSFARAISQEPENLSMYAKRFAWACKDLHGRRCDVSKFPSIKETILAAAYRSKDFSKEDQDKIIDFIKSIPDETTCVHGDMHIGNILTTGKEEFWIDLSDFGYGNHYFDLGTFFFVMCCCPGPICEKLFHISAGQCHEVWKEFAAEYFGKDADIAAEEQKVRPFAALTALYFGERDHLFPEMRMLIESAILGK